MSKSQSFALASERYRQESDKVVSELAKLVKRTSQSIERESSERVVGSGKASPTGRLIDFRNKRSASKTKLARKSTPQKSFERIIAYSNNPKAHFETSLQQLEEVKDKGSQRDEKHQIEGQMEEWLADDFLPVIHEKIERM